VVARRHQQVEAAQEQGHLRGIVLAGGKDARAAGLGHAAVDLASQEFIDLLHADQGDGLVLLYHDAVARAA